MDKEGYFNHKTKTFLHITKDCIMDCNPKSYKYILGLEKEIEEKDKELERLNNIINELEKYIHNELVSDFYNDDMPCELIINKMEKLFKRIKGE